MAQGNGLLAILKHILFRFLDKHDRPFVAPRIEKYGGPQTFKTYAEVEAAFVLPEGDSGKLMAGDLKSGIRDLLNEFLHPLREKINEKVCISLFYINRPNAASSPSSLFSRPRLQAELASRAYPHQAPVVIAVSGKPDVKKAVPVAAPKKGKVATATRTFILTYLGYQKWFHVDGS